MIPWQINFDIQHKEKPSPNLLKILCACVCDEDGETDDDNTPISEISGIYYAASDTHYSLRELLRVDIDNSFYAQWAEIIVDNEMYSYLLMLENWSGGLRIESQ